MKSSEVVDFLLPQLSDPLQVGFLAIILAMMSFTVISAHRHARPASWEKKWNRGTPNDHRDDLDIEHGSVTDLWNAVATSPEKLAEIMPGMLLVVGLLGTFLGLGLALNHASNILGHPSALSASGAPDSMQELLGMLQGLGTKFKTSTWGITGFVLLKIWSEITRFEEKRLSWVIGKVKTELEKRKQAQFSAETNKQEILFSKIGGAADKIIRGFSEQIVLLMAQNKDLHRDSLRLIDDSFKGANEELRSIHSEDRATIQNGVESVREELRIIHSESHAAIEKSTKDIHKNLGLLHADTCSTIQNSVKDVCEDLTAIHAETRATSESMAQFTRGTQGVVENMAEAAQRMAGGADKVGDAANQLVNAIDAFKSQFTVVLDNVRKDLGTAIQDMSSQASATLERGSAQLGDATLGISAALAVLSSDVKETMGEVKGSINKALDIQQRGAQEFTLSSKALNENIAATTGMVDKLSRPIEDGLRSVSEAGQHMRGIGKSLERSIKSMEELVTPLFQLPVALEPLKTFPSKQQALISAFESLAGLPKQQEAVLRELQGLRGDLATELRTSFAPISEISRQRDVVISELQGLRNDLSNDRTSVLSQLIRLLNHQKAVFGKPQVLEEELHLPIVSNELENTVDAEGY